MIPILRLTPPLKVFGSDCCCPRAPGACSPPYDLQPASLAGPPRPLPVSHQVAILLSGSILEHLVADSPAVAVSHLDHLASIVAQF